MMMGMGNGSTEHMMPGGQTMNDGSSDGDDAREFRSMDSHGAHALLLLR